MEQINDAAKLAVKEAIKDGATTITLLTGSAPAQPALYNPNPVSITGTLDAPSRFTEIRVFEQKESHCLVNVSEGTIKLIVNEQETINKFTVEGKVYDSKIFKELGLNANKTWTPEILQKTLRLKRAIFESKAEHTALMATLKNIKAKVNQEVEQGSETNGNRNQLFRQTVDSNMPPAFTLKIAIFEGMPPRTIEVNTILEVIDGDIYCLLESADAAEFAENYKADVIEKEVEKLKDRTTIIYV